MTTLFRIAKKEFGTFFSSPIAFIFMGVFLAATLFIFFWVEKFFATDLAEIRPLFSWMPLLMIFLTASVTMRLWAEERRAGTLEFLLASPVSPCALVLGKFFACLALVIISLLLTLPLAVTVSFMGPLDWGPVIGGYLATIFLAAAYISIGLFVSVKSDNQIVSMISTSLICLLFYLIGSHLLSSFFGTRGAEILQLFGTGSRFASITRGVIDARDLYYYLTIMGVFLSLNIYSLEKIHWADNPPNPRHRRWQLLSWLMVLNFVTVNFWLAPLGSLRLDMTKGKIYSISETTRSYLSQLKEPLLIRGYFSAQTHPLLAPLVPRLRDLLAEYAVAGGNKVHVEFIDPTEHPELEQEAGQKYGIRPVPFQTASKYQAAVTNSYFDLLIQYGDQYEVLGFKDLIEIKTNSEQDLQVDLRNPEYDITRAMKKVLYSYRSGGDIFTEITAPVTFTGYFSPDAKLPKELVTLKKEIAGLTADLQKEAGDKFTTTIVDPDSGNGNVAEKLKNQYGFRPMAASLLDSHTFWFYMTLTSGDQFVEIPLPEDLDSASLKRVIDAGLQRFGSGFAKTIALNTPKQLPPMPQMGMMPPQGPTFNVVKQLLEKEHKITETDLANGHFPENADLLMVLSPESLSQQQLFAMDQFLMQGGTVVIAASPYSIGLTEGLTADMKATGLKDWLAFNGLGIGDQLVMDNTNSSFPVPTERQVGGFTVQETRLVNYPYFVDIRPDGMNEKSGFMTGMNQLTMTWPSPILVDGAKNEGRQITRLLESSPDSWLSSDVTITPDFKKYGERGFAMGKNRSRQLLAVAIEGKFTSYFAGKPSPLETAAASEQAQTKAAATEQKAPFITRQIDHSPESARIILFSSATFASDMAISIASATSGTNYLNPVQILTNAADWSLEDRGLLAIRGRGHFSRTLLPMDRDMQLFWEYGNYLMAALGLALVWFIKRSAVRRNERRYQAVLQQNCGRI